MMRGWMMEGTARMTEWIMMAEDITAATTVMTDTMDTTGAIILLK
jgi:hypothetical protein